MKNQKKIKKTHTLKMDDVLTRQERQYNKRLSFILQIYHLMFTVPHLLIPLWMNR